MRLQSNGFPKCGNSWPQMEVFRRVIWFLLRWSLFYFWENFWKNLMSQFELTFLQSITLVFLSAFIWNGQHRKVELLSKKNFINKKFRTFSVSSFLPIGINFYSTLYFNRIGIVFSQILVNDFFQFVTDKQKTMI